MKNDIFAERKKNPKQKYMWVGIVSSKTECFLQNLNKTCGKFLKKITNSIKNSRGVGGRGHPFLITNYQSLKVGERVAFMSNVRSRPNVYLKYKCWVFNFNFVVENF
jgi:hypothetical protein